MGPKKDLSLTALRITARKAFLSPSMSEQKEVEVLLPSKDDDLVRAVIEAVLIGTYVWKKYKTDKYSIPILAKRIPEVPGTPLPWHPRFCCCRH